MKLTECSDQSADCGPSGCSDCSNETADSQLIHNDARKVNAAYKPSSSSPDNALKVSAFGTVDPV